MLKGDMAMRKLIIPIQFIMVIGCLAFNGYAENNPRKGSPIAWGWSLF
jgi:hypothetical protein